MRNFLIVTIAALFAVVMFVSCGGSKTDSTVKVIPLYESLKGSAPVEAITDFKSARVIPLETSDSILFHMRWIDALSDSHIVADDKGTLYFFNLSDGSFSHKINRYGRGPQEYLNVYRVLLDEEKQYVSVFDHMGIKKYNYNGEFIQKIDNDSLTFVGVAESNEDEFVVSFPSNMWRKYEIAVYDNEWNPLKTYFEKRPMENEGNYNTMMVNIVRNFNGEAYAYVNDTLFSVTSEKVTPFIYVDKNRLKAPAEILHEGSSEKDRYISGELMNLVGDKCFFSYNYEGNRYYEQWDVASGKLMCRNVENLNGSRIGKGGLPFIINGKLVHVWPDHVNDNKMYCILTPEQSSVMYPDFNEEDDNPVILEIVL